MSDQILPQSSTAPSVQVGPASLKPQTIVITDKKELYKSYMPFIKGGGLFIQFNDDLTPAKIVPGQKVFIILGLLDSKMKTPLQGKVIWINKGGFNKGFGISLGDSPAIKALKENIESNIADIAAKKEATYTL